MAKKDINHYDYYQMNQIILLNLKQKEELVSLNIGKCVLNGLKKAQNLLK